MSALLQTTSVQETVDRLSKHKVIADDIPAAEPAARCSKLSLLSLRLPHACRASWAW